MVQTEMHQATVYFVPKKEFKLRHVKAYIRLKTSSNNELADEDLLSPTSSVRFIITKDSPREGWDCGGDN